MGGHAVQGFLQQLVIDIPRSKILTVFLAFCLILLLTHTGNHGLLISIYQIAEIIPELRRGIEAFLKTLLYVAPIILVGVQRMHLSNGC